MIILAAMMMALGGPAQGLPQVTAPGAARVGDVLVVHGPDGSSVSLAVSRSRGYATVSHESLRQLGWAVDVDVPQLRARLGSDGPVVEFSVGSPLFSWDEELLQMVSAPFSSGGSVQIPLQFVVDFLPAQASDAYAFSSDESVLQILDTSIWLGLSTASRGGRRGRGGSERRVGSSVAEVPLDEPASTVDVSSALQEDITSTQDLEKRVVVIDPGHGGRDPGTTGGGGRREKDIALAIGRYLERELRGDEDLEVYMTRDRDVLIPLWERGPQATEWKGDRAGAVFISIHVNSSPAGPSIRGFETYFLSDARTEHERRVAAIENAPLEQETEVNSGDVQGVDLTFIMRELRTLDHQHWSSLLAEGIQFELEEVHPGPNRGVKQAPLAVLTNALMPAVLVEVGYISNREEERVLSRSEFQRGVAAALAKGIRDFFERYPPGQGVAGRNSPR